MQIILASAKIMRERARSKCCPEIIPGEPRFLKQARMLASELARKSGGQLSELFSCSAAIGEQNRQRFQIFGSDEAEIMPAILTYYGQAYKHLDAETLSAEDLEWANSHLWISSCLYGLLRPLDGINTYRMEGGFTMESTAGERVNDFWKPLLTDLLIESVKADDGVLIYLDTEEFRALFNWKRVLAEITVIEPEFHIIKNGKLTTPAVWAKTCRGAMTRYIIEHRLTDPAQLTNFSYKGFAFSEQTLSAPGSHGSWTLHHTSRVQSNSTASGAVIPLLFNREA